MQESRSVDHMKHTFMSFSKIFQIYTHARITKCGSRER